MPSLGKPRAGAGYVVLNVFRAANIVALLAVMAASTAMLVKMVNNKSFFFFDACENLIRTIIAGFLVSTETPWFKRYIARYWPLFSHNSGFVMLGTTQILLGNGTLANLNKENASQENIGMACWRLIIGAGISVYVMGFLNMLASYIFRDTTMNLTARQVRSHGAVAGHKLEVESSIGSATPKSSPTKPNVVQRMSAMFRRDRDSLPSYRVDAYMSQVKSPVPPVPAIPNAYSTPQQRQYTASGNLRMPDPNDSHYHSVNEKCVQSPGAASSKYSDEGSIRRPDHTHHPAMRYGA